jgi:hypothetical protein
MCLMFAYDLNVNCLAMSEIEGGFMRKNTTDIETSRTTVASRGRRRFRIALDQAAECLAVPPMRLTGTSVWVFGRPQPTVLRWVHRGRVELRKQMLRGESFVILGLAQAAALSEWPLSRKVVAALLPPHSTSTLKRRRISIHTRSHSRVPR